MATCAASANATPDYVPPTELVLGAIKSGAAIGTRKTKYQRLRAFEIGAGVAARLAEQISGFAEFSYTTNLDSQHLQVIRGTIGIRHSW